jgi:hypothetical protein
MNAKTHLLLFALIISCKAGTEKTPTGEVVNSGFVAGFAEGTTTASGKTLFFEASSLLKVEDKYLIANDKPIPGHCPLVAIQAKAFSNEASNPSFASPIDAAAFEKSEKVESTAHGRDFSFAATDFEWITNNPAEADTYNNLVRWPKTDVSQAVLLHATERDGVRSSRILRDSFSAALHSAKYPSGPPYYKVEGLEQIDNQCLIFGIREVGTDYEHPEPCFVLLEASIEKGSDQLPTISRSFTKSLEFSPKVPGLEDLQFGLTSLESDEDNKVFIASTASENNGVFKSVFWIFSRTDGRFSQPRLIYNLKGEPLVLTHKVEGLVFDSNNTFLAICDDDRELTTVATSGSTLSRKPNEAAYFHIKISDR